MVPITPFVCVPYESLSVEARATVAFMYPGGRPTPPFHPVHSHPPCTIVSCVCGGAARAGSPSQRTGPSHPHRPEAGAAVASCALNGQSMPSTNTFNDDMCRCPATNRQLERLGMKIVNNPRILSSTCFCDYCLLDFETRFDQLGTASALHQAKSEPF